MPATLDISGQKHNLLTAIEKTGRQTQNKQYYWLCRCDCGNLTEVNVGNITSGRTKSCGCLSLRKGQDSPNYKHGFSTKNHPDYKRYQREKFDLCKYNLSPEQKEQIMQAQNGRCAICGYSFGQKVGDMHVDHDHKSGNVRGFLCDLCNRGLGYFKDNAAALKQAAIYIKAHEV